MLKSDTGIFSWEGASAERRGKGQQPGQPRRGEQAPTLLRQHEMGTFTAQGSGFCTGYLLSPALVVLHL